MIISPQTWLRLAAFIVPENRKEWLNAMEAEMTIIEGEHDRKNFARGCALAGLKAFSRSRRGLNLIARGAGAAFITSVSVCHVVMGRIEIRWPEHRKCAADNEFMCGLSFGRYFTRGVVEMAARLCRNRDNTRGV